MSGDLLDVHAAFGAGHDDRPGGRAIKQDRDIKFLLNIGRGLDQYFAHQPSFRPCLLGDQSLAKHRLRRVTDFIDALQNLDATLEAILKCAFSPSTSVNLGFDHKGPRAIGIKLLARSPHFLGCRIDASGWNRDPVLAE